MHRFLDQLEIQPDTLCLDIARTPPGFHLLHASLGHLHTDDRFPFRDQWSNPLLEPLAIPGYQQALASRGIASWTHDQIHSLIVADNHFWRAFIVHHIEQATVSLMELMKPSSQSTWF